MPKIAVYGAGGVGGYYGARLAAAGNEVVFVARGAQLEALQRTGIEVRSILGDVRLTQVHAAGRLPPGGYDAVLICVKAHDTASIIPDLRQNSGTASLLVSLQNGVENEGHLAASLGEDRVAGAAAFITAEVTAPGVIAHKAAGHVVMGALVRDSQPRVAKLVDLFKAAGIEAALSEDIRGDLWTKLCWNAAFNSTTAAANAPVGSIFAADGGEELIRALMQEVVAVALAEGVRINPGAIDRYIQVTRTMSEARTSMLVDRERGRTMEYDAINGAVVRYGRKHGIATPANLAMYVVLQAIGRGEVRP